MGLGKGKGSDQTSNVLAGSCCALGFGICFLILGLPMLIAGIVMVQIYKDIDDNSFYDEPDATTESDFAYAFDEVADDVESGVYKAGIALIVISVVCLVGGIVTVVLLCTGCCGRNNSTNAHSTMTVTTTHHQQYPIQLSIPPEQYPGYDQPRYDQPVYGQPPNIVNKQNNYYPGLYPVQ